MKKIKIISLLAALLLSATGYGQLKVENSGKVVVGPESTFWDATSATPLSICGANIYAGKAVTGSKPQGDVILQPDSNVTFDADDDVILERGFEVKKGAIFNVE